MNPYTGAIAWLLDPAHWTGDGSIPQRLTEHILYCLITLVIAMIIAIPAGLYIGHTGRGRAIVVPFTGALRALPTLGLVILLALWLGLGLIPPLIALVVLAIPPILAGAYAGVESVDPVTRDAATATGFTAWGVLTRVEVPLALPLIVGGIRSATLQVIATWTVAAYLPLGGLGRFLYDGLPVRNYAEMLGGSILVILLALVVDGLFALTQRFVTPKGVIAGRVRDVRTPTRSTQRKERTWFAPEA
ncbi:ABC transporter permease [Microbacterium rhizosphaerae]|jgi:osmoprotectant transport system permease protein|uniref:ABC transporter permease n=1 Tax=Microbacterium rhizosphaerae TaxID=1678237 RepID=A0ABZ0SSA3_9MICO|nr:ABC transporter permease [Microbacterium rhizosphaerae]WPR91129.1 ABC transporter permease [Microbacterium rhizosphaerae]